LRAFGNKVFDVIEAELVRLREVDGIGPVRASRITAAWAEQKVVREIMVFLHSHGVGTARAVRIYKTYGADAVQVMSENPYHLARDIRGIGFKTADAIAMKLGVDKTAMIRVRSGISYALTEAMDDGHCGLPTDELVPLAEKLLEISLDLIRTALDLELAEGTVVTDRVGETDYIFLAGLCAGFCCALPPVARRSESTRLPVLRPRRSIACSKLIQRKAVFGGTPRILSAAIYLLSMKHRGWMSCLCSHSSKRAQ
jgi:exodeoxyribonuclease V alpha subunit